MTDTTSQIRSLASASDGNYPELVESSIAAGASPDQFFADLLTLENREPVSIASGQVLVAGEVLFQSLTASATAGGGNHGNGTATIQAVGVDALPGTYTATCTATRTNRGIFELRDSLGYVLGRANVGTPYVSDILGFTIADGSTDFAIGDTFAIVVTGSASLASYDFTASASPPQVAAAVLGEDVDTTGGAAEQFAIATGPSIVAAGFTYITQPTTGLTDEQLSAFSGVAELAVEQLARRGIVLRGGGIGINRRAPPTDS
jgi:hypothetical protein